MNKRFLDRAVCSRGYPNFAFEAWYQQGMLCFTFRFPRWLRKQVFSKLVRSWQASNKPISIWQIRAFLYGASGADSSGAPYVDIGYTWPEDPPKGWEAVVCCYQNGLCDFDYVHPVSRRFWSEDNGFPLLPADPNKIMCAAWFADLGFSVFHMNPNMQVEEGAPVAYLKTDRQTTKPATSGQDTGTA